MLPPPHKEITEYWVQYMLNHTWKSERPKRKWKNPLVAANAHAQRQALRQV